MVGWPRCPPPLRWPTVPGAWTVKHGHDSLEEQDSFSEEFLRIVTLTKSVFVCGQGTDDNRRADVVDRI